MTSPAGRGSAASWAMPPGLTQFGVNLLRLTPGVWSSQRHWHTEQDEFVYVFPAKWCWSPMPAKRF